MLSPRRAHSLLSQTTRHARFSTATPKPNSRLERYSRRTAYTLAGLAGVWAADAQFNASALTRNARTLYTCLVITADYKLNFTPEKSEGIPALHERVADRVYDLLVTNGGLYIKIGQAIANNAAVLPAPMQEKFGQLFDKAPQIPYEVVEKVFKAQFGRPPAGPDGVFEYFEEAAAASASIAQVHRAKLRHPEGKGAWVAVKIQKPDVGKQVDWDLGAYKLAMRAYQWAFDLPVAYFADFICAQMRKELDFSLEAANAQRMAALVAADPHLAGRVHVPLVYPEYSGERVMTAEWIEGVPMSDRRAIRQLMGEAEPNPTPTFDAPSPDTSSPPSRYSIPAHWQTPLVGGTQAIMRTLVDLFGAQIFQYGLVHCDPHPGNILVRPDPARRERAQVVLLDHGLYVELSDQFRREYATLWKALLAGDARTVKDVASGWGFGAIDVFASMTLMRAVKLRDPDKKHVKGTGMWEEGLSQYERGVRMKAKMKSLFEDTEKMPQELVFLLRNMRMVQGNNQALGSPVNRVKLTALSASRALVSSPSLTLGQTVVEYWHHTRFRMLMFALDVAFLTTRVRQWWRRRLGLSDYGFEDEMERAMRGIAKAELGYDVGAEAFRG